MTNLAPWIYFKPHSKFDTIHGIVHSLLMTDILSYNFRIKIKMVIVFF